MAVSDGFGSSVCKTIFTYQVAVFKLCHRLIGNRHRPEQTVELRKRLIMVRLRVTVMISFRVSFSDCTISSQYGRLNSLTGDFVHP